MTDECIFCGIVDGNLPASLVSDDDRSIAFMDIQPVNAGHVLVIPREHAARLADLDEDTGAHLFRIGQRITQALYESELRCEGVNMVLADGAAAGQDVFHVHLHVFPRYAGDGFTFQHGPTYGETPTRDELDTVAAQIRGAL